MCYNISMSKILIIGNVLKDVYLKLDNRQNDFEEDAQGIQWLDLAFNGAKHGFFKRTSVYGGAAVSMAVLSRLGVEAKILGSQTEFKNGEILWQDRPDDYRYILCHEGEITYFMPSSRKVTDWVTPNGTPEWLLIDRSATISARLVDEVKNFIKFSPATKIAVHVEKNLTPDGRRLAEMADVLFVEDEPPVHTEEKIVDKIDLGTPSKQLTCHISPRKIVLNDAEESWVLSKTDMMTHLTVYSTIVATVLGVIAAGGSAADAVLWARLNAEHATLEASLSAKKLQELAKIEREKRENMKLVAQSLMTPRMGILAADESERILTERLVKFGIPANTNTRKEYRKMLLSTPELKEYASGVILSEETAKTKTERGQNFLEYLTGRGIITGIKADQGQVQFGDTDETYSLGEIGLIERLRDYYHMGARFAKWHAKFTIGKDMPSFQAVERAAELLAGFVKECQLVGIVPMIESDVSWAGDYTIEQSLETTNRVLTVIFEKLERRRVDFDSIILKTNMISAGSEAVAGSTPREVAMATSAVMKHTVPKYIAGVVFMSGGQAAKVATQNLAAICKEKPFPWPVSYAFGRALQDPVMQTWKGKEENVKAAQAALKRHLQDNSEAIRS